MVVCGPKMIMKFMIFSVKFFIIHDKLSNKLVAYATVIYNWLITQPSQIG